MENFIKLRPRTVEELEKFNCFSSMPRTKCRLYGKDIVDIIISVVGDKD